MKNLLSIAIAAASLATTGAAANANECGSYSNPYGKVTVIKKVPYQPVINQLGADASTGCMGGRFTHKPSSKIKPRVTTASATDLTVGSVVTAPTNFLGNEAGFVLLQLGEAVHECEVIEWCANKVTFRVPDMGLKSKVPAELQLVRPDGRIVRSYKVCLVRKPDLIVHEQPTPSASVGAGSLQIERAPQTAGLLLTPAS